MLLWQAWMSKFGRPPFRYVVVHNFWNILISSTYSICSWLEDSAIALSSNGNLRADMNHKGVKLLSQTILRMWYDPPLGLTP